MEHNEALALEKYGDESTVSWNHIRSYSPISAGSKSVRLDSARIKDCFILGYCDVQIMDPENFREAGEKDNLTSPSSVFVFWISMRRTNLLVEMFQGRASGNSPKPSSKVLPHFA